MENIRTRLTFGNKVEDVKLRKRKSQLYSKEDESPLNDGELRTRVVVFSVAFRVINCFLVQTSFVPDEYWQSLEVSHRMVFDYGYVTWEWKEGLRGFTYPLFFAFIYKLLYFINYDSVHLLIWLPRIIQALFAAFADVKFFFLIRRLEGCDVAKWTFFCHMCSWFSWYCCTRTLTNSMETTITCLALSYFPLPGSQTHSSKIYLTLVALAVVVRPTALIVWFPLVMYHFWLETNKLKLITLNLVPIGALAVVISTVIDCIFYEKWTMVQFNFLKFNVFHSVADFYGSHPWHWYFTQGFAVVIGPHFPLFLHGCSIAYKRYTILLAVVVWTIGVYSLLPHKEFRFIYPVLPFCMIFCGISLANLKTWRRTAAFILLVSNLVAALYTGLVHQRGPLVVMGYLQTLCDVSSTSTPPQPDVLFLMPCHSTPYYSHVHCPMKMRFLECPPDLGEEGYVDEADRFYDDPLHWLRTSFPYKSFLPTHLVLFDVLEKDISVFLQGNKFVRTAEIFHTHFPEGRVGGSIFIYERH
ncbi:GPI mannosyltransferase 3 isoform X2 [Cyclopterus lumpus]|nr:GPI mannosyltransferase 3 isoform X2 [Cyclopterus lumpus]XP_034385355.1 GPI mannosyltransferase 3 isoform X2 [Cyclopterus lumpus]XP_034385356.1 GPI mannosyltransferase 3 isoform X2 [Cyclopterus lumpus]